MKTNKYLLILFIAGFMFTAQSCFQDLDQDPAFDYPEQPERPSTGNENLMFNLSFDDSFEDDVNATNATVVGSPTFGVGKSEKAYQGAADSYLTFSTDDLNLGAEISFVFWYKVNSSPDRSGIITISPVTQGAAANAQNNRTSGIRIFREASGTKQIIKGNIGNGTADAWVDGGDAATVDPAANSWVHVAFTVSATKAILYLNGEPVKDADLTGLSWAGCDILSIGSGAPRFTEWNHLSDESLIDELSIYNKVLTQAEIVDIMDFFN